MKRKLLKILLPIIALSTASTMLIYASDNNLKFNESELIISQSNIKQPRWSWTGNVYLDSQNYCNITTYNNFFNDSPKVTNDILNKGVITVRAINEKGEIICSEVSVEAGSTVKLNKIGAFEGKITFQAKADSSRNYRLNLT